MLPAPAMDRSKRLREALPAVSAAVASQKVADSGNTWNDLRRGLTDLKKEPGKLDTLDLPTEGIIDDVWEFILGLMQGSPKYARQIIDAISMLIRSERWADGLLRAKRKHRLSLWKLSAAGIEPSPAELAAAVLKLGVQVDELLPTSALESGTGFVEDLAAKLVGPQRAALEASALGVAWREAAASSSMNFMPEGRVSEGDLGTLAEANEAQAASIEAAGKTDRRPGCRKDVVDNLLDLTEEALNIAARCLEPMMSGYEGETNIATSARAKVLEFRQRQADLQAQLVVLGPCQVGKTSLTYSLVGFAALPPENPSMVTTRWVHTPSLAVPRLTMPEALCELLQVWAQRLGAESPKGLAVEGIDAVAEALALAHRTVHRGRTAGKISSQELEVLSRPSMCLSVEVAFSALANLEGALTDTGALSIVDLPSPDDALWEVQDVQQLCRRALQEADGVLVVVDASKYEVPRWMSRLLRDAFVQDRVLRREDAWIVANHIDQLAEFFCKDGVTDVCQRVKKLEHHAFHDVIVGEDHVIPTAARLSLLAIYGSRQVTDTLSNSVLATLDREPWFAQICSFLFGYHWAAKVKDMERHKWRQAMRELQLLGQVTGPLANSVLKTAYVKMLPRSVARVMFDLSQLISSFVSSLLALEGTSVTIDAEQVRLVFQTYLEDVQKRAMSCLQQNAPTEADAAEFAAMKCSGNVVFDDANSTELNNNYFTILAREATSYWQPSFVKAVAAACDEALKAHQKWQRSLDYYLIKGGADAATKQKLLLDSKNLAFMSCAEGYEPLKNPDRDRLVAEHAGKVTITTSKQLFHRTKRTYLIKPENTSAFTVDLLCAWMHASEAEIVRRCIQPIQDNFDDMCRSIEEQNNQRLAGARRRKDAKAFDFSFAHALAEVLPKIASFNASQDSTDDVLAAEEADSCEKLCEEVRQVLQDLDKKVP